MRRRDSHVYRNSVQVVLLLLLVTPLLLWIAVWQDRQLALKPSDVAHDGQVLVSAYRPYRTLDRFPSAATIVAQLSRREIAAVIANKQAIDGYLHPDPAARDNQPAPVFVKASPGHLHLSSVVDGYLLQINAQAGRQAKLRGVPKQIPLHKRRSQLFMLGIEASFAVIILLHAELQFWIARWERRKKLQAAEVQ